MYFNLKSNSCANQNLNHYRLIPAPKIHPPICLPKIYWCGYGINAHINAVCIFARKSKRERVDMKLVTKIIDN